MKYEDCIPAALVNFVLSHSIASKKQCCVRYPSVELLAVISVRMIM
jgi:hypothetical protein